jgi:hypothetical protein
MTRIFRQFENLDSAIFFSNALAFAANQHTRHLVRRFARLGQGRVRAVPFGVVGIMTRGTSLAMITLSTTGTVQHNLVRSCQPIFIDEEIWRFCRSRLSDQPRFGNNLLQL